MINEELLAEVIPSLVFHIQSLHATLGSVAAELVAVRAAVKGLDPTFEETLRLKRETNPIATFAPQMDAEFQKLIHRLKTDLIR